MRALPLLLILLAAPAGAAAPRLVLVGGGARPPEALERFVAWAGGSKARLLVLGWASSEPDAADVLAAEIRPFGPAALDAFSSTASARGFERLLSSATGVFFTGGDQVRLMAAVDALGLAGRLRALSKAGVVFGGTSAGTAVMSPLMITGEGDFTKLDAAHVGTAPGLGLLPGTVVDQHFLKRRRQNRLLGLVGAHPELLGLGVDEDTALLVDGTLAECVGATAAMAVRSTGPGTWSVELVGRGARYDLAAKKLLPK